MNFNLDRTIEILSSTPAALDALLRPLSGAWTDATEGPETWSPYDIIGHLIHSEEENWIPRAKVILHEGEGSPFEPLNRVAMLEEPGTRSMAELLDRFQQLRAENLKELERMNLTPVMLRKRGTHPAFGAVTLEQLLSTWTVHDLAHTAQIARVMAKQYREAVGPWEAYLPILSR